MAAGRLLVILLINMRMSKTEKSFIGTLNLPLPRTSQPHSHIYGKTFCVGTRRQTFPFFRISRSLIVYLLPSLAKGYLDQVRHTHAYYMAINNHMYLPSNLSNVDSPILPSASPRSGREIVDSVGVNTFRRTLPMKTNDNE